MNKLAKYTERSQGLAKYDPKKGMKKIAFLEMVEKHYATAKDASQLIVAIRAKLEAQAEFVLWWDTQGPGKEGKGNVTDRTHYSGRDGLPERKPVSRWRAKLNDPDKFEKTYQEICAKYPKLLEFEKMAHVGQSSGYYEWYSPPDYIEAATRVLGSIDLDPASSAAANDVVKATTYYTLDQDGLRLPWRGRLWLNPPYGQPIIEWFTAKLAASVTSGEVSAAIVLVNNGTETAWFHTLASLAQAMCFPEGRLRFWNPDHKGSTPLQGQVVVYIGPHAAAFVREFHQFGFVLVRPDDAAVS